jgi:hypothetical protein
VARIGRLSGHASARVNQPVEADGRVVTFWESVSRETVYAPIRDVAALIKRLHELARPVDVVLPELQPFGSPGDRLPQFAGLPPADAQFLRQRIDWARKAFPLVPFTLPPGPIHGDANVGNVICDDHGQAVLIDLDSFATGAREWDLIQTALFADRPGVALGGGVPRIRPCVRIRYHGVGRLLRPRRHARDRDDVMARQEGRGIAGRGCRSRQANPGNSHWSKSPRLGRLLTYCESPRERLYSGLAKSLRPAAQPRTPRRVRA